MIGPKERYKLAAENRRARFDYTIIDTFEAGLVLKGSEIKSLRMGRASIAESHAAEKLGEIYLFNATIQEYSASSLFPHEPKRPRKLLLKKKQIGKIIGSVTRKGMTIVPLNIFFNNRGFAKISIGLAKGKKQADKREAEKERDWKRNKERILKNRE